MIDFQTGINMVDGLQFQRVWKAYAGVAISDFRKIDDRIGDMNDIRRIAEEFRKRDIFLVLDIVLNHTSDEHEWAKGGQG